MNPFGCVGPVFLVEFKPRDFPQPILGPQILIKNVGDCDAIDFEYEINVTGGILGLINKSWSGDQSLFVVDEEILIDTGTFFGLGVIEFSVTVDAWNAKKVSFQGYAMIILFFIIIR